MKLIDTNVLSTILKKIFFVMSFLGHIGNARTSSSCQLSALELRIYLHNYPRKIHIFSVVTASRSRRTSDVGGQERLGCRFQSR